MSVWDAIGRASEQGFVSAQFVHGLPLELRLPLLLNGHRLLLERLAGCYTLRCLLVMSGALTNHSLRVSAGAPVRDHA